MKCIEARRKVTPFINQKLSLRKSEEFLNHVEKCEDCMNELETFFMLYKAIDILDSDAHYDNYDFDKKLHTHIRNVKLKIATAKIVRALRVLLFVIVECLCLLCVYTRYHENKGSFSTTGIKRMLELSHTIPGRKAQTEAPIAETEFETEAPIAETEFETENLIEEMGFETEAPISKIEFETEIWAESEMRTESEMQTEEVLMHKKKTS